MTMVRRKRFWLSLVIMLFLFFPLLWISQYNYPSGDDYVMARHAKELGATGATKWWYFNGCARYSYSFLQSLISSYDNWISIYKVFPVVLLFAGFGCLYYFVRAFFGPEVGATTSFTLSATMYTLLISLTPDIATGLYWLTTSLQYAAAVFTSLLLFALYIDFTRSTKSLLKTIYAVLLSILIAVLAGLNEASALFLIATFGLINCLYFAKFKRPDKWGLAFLALSVIFGLVSFLGPGTHARIRQVETEFHLLKTLSGSIGVTLYLLAEFLTSIPIPVASILYLAFLNSTRDKLARPRSLLQGVRWYWILLFMILAVTAVNFVIFTAIGVNSLTDRLKTVYFYSIFLGWFLLLTALFVELSAKQVNFYVPGWVIGVLTAFVLGFLFTGYKLELSSKNVIPSSTSSQRLFSSVITESVYTNAYLDILSGRAQRFYRQNQERESQLMNGNDTVKFSLYSYVPETIFIQDVNHPFGAPDSMSMIICGKVKTLHPVETGPPAPPKEKF